MADATARDIPWPSARLGWSATLLLSLAAVVSYLDRVVINLLVEPIKADFALSDTGFATLQGVAFGLFYTVMAFPLGRLADSRSRRLVVAFGLGAFSLFSMTSGLARTFTQLFVARIGVGIGEASLTPASYSMLSDYFPPHRLGRALGVFTMSAYAGIGLAFIAGGGVIAFLATLPPVSLPLLGLLKPWQMAFVIVGLPGLLMAPLLLLIREPARRGAAQGQRSVPLAQVGAEMWQRRRVLAPMFGGFAMVVLPGYAGTVWTPALFIRAYHWDAATIGLWYGLLYMLCGMGGVFFAGWLCDRLTARGVLDAPLRVAAYGFVGFGLFGALAPLMPTPLLSLALFAPAIFLSTMPYPLAGAAIQFVTSNRMRAQVTALYLTVVNLIGLGLGPIIVGLFTDHLFSRPEDVRYSLAIVNLFCAPAAFCLLAATFRPYRTLRARTSVSAGGIQ